MRAAIKRTQGFRHTSIDVGYAVAIAHFSGKQCFAVATPEWLERNGPISHPNDLAMHECVRFRLASGKILRWEFEKDGQQILIDVNGRITVGDGRLALRAAADGLGPAYVFEHLAQPFMESGQLVRLLENWCPNLPSFVLYYSRQRQVSTALRAFIETARQFTAG